MVLGEFGYSDIDDSFPEDDWISKVFTMILLMFMIFFGSVAMINLFVGVVVSDVGKLKEETFLEVKKTTHLLKNLQSEFPKWRLRGFLVSLCCVKVRMCLF